MRWAGLWPAILMVGAVASVHAGQQPTGPRIRWDAPGLLNLKLPPQKYDLPVRETLEGEWMPFFLPRKQHSKAFKGFASVRAPLPAYSAQEFLDEEREREEAQREREINEKRAREAGLNTPSKPRRQRERKAEEYIGANCGLACASKRANDANFFNREGRLW